MYQFDGQKAVCVSPESSNWQLAGNIVPFRGKSSLLNQILVNWTIASLLPLSRGFFEFVLKTELVTYLLFEPGCGVLDYFALFALRGWSFWPSVSCSSR
jgi:hypothetical protein